MAWYFVFFVVSGFCSLVYQVVWLRLVMAAFGVTTPTISLVLSVFMAGLAAGSWGGGRLATALASRGSAATYLRLYAVAELVIGAGGVAVPAELGWGRALLLDGVGAGLVWGSASYYLASGVWVAVTLLPPCLAMGATLPLAMAALRAQAAGGRSFSFLYLANVMGAAAGTLVSAFVLIELFGFRGTLAIVASLNAALAAAALALGRRVPAAPAPAGTAGPAAAAAGSGEGLALWGLFLTGAVSLALEVVWIRQFTPFLGTLVYAFAGILAVYLLATLLGSKAYRIWVAGRPVHEGSLAVVVAWVGLGVTGLLPLLTTDPRLPLPDLLRLVLGIGPFCALTGFVTPLLVDRWSAGDPGRAGSAYAVNVVGCIVGPLLASFAVLPAAGERAAELLLALPLLATALLAVLVPSLLAGLDRARARRDGGAVLAAGALAALVAFLATRGFEELFPRREVRRDHTATVIAIGEGRGKHMLVNGVGITSLTPITKMMAHLPLAALGRPPRRGLVVAFGMGTSFRSMLSWGIPTTAVELVPSVPGLVGYYHADGPQLLRSPLARVVIDDGRRYLEWAAEEYDVITVDPPPPVEAAGSSLLYSRQFYEIAGRRLAPDGILQQWFPGGEAAILVSVARALAEAFPHVRVFRSVEGWGFHFLAGRRPLGELSAPALAERLPPAAVTDLLEWGPQADAPAQFAAVVQREIPIQAVLALAPRMPAVEDDRPTNEYFLLRRTFADRR